MVLRPRGHDYDVPQVTYEATKRSFMMRCLYGQKDDMLWFCCLALDDYRPTSCFNRYHTVVRT